MRTSTGNGVGVGDGDGGGGDAPRDPSAIHIPFTRITSFWVAMGRGLSRSSVLSKPQRGCPKHANRRVFMPVPVGFGESARAVRARRTMGFENRRIGKRSARPRTARRRYPASSPSVAARLLVKRELLTPTLDGFRHLAESASLARKLVRHAHRRTVPHVPEHEAALFEVFEASRQHLVSRPLSPLTKLAEAQRPTQKDVQDERVPRAAQHVDGELKSTAPRIDPLGHGFPAITFQRIAA